MRVVNQQVPTPFRDIDRGTLMRRTRSSSPRARRCCRCGCSAWRASCVGQLRSASLIDLVVGLAEGLPSGLYDGRGIEHYLETVLGDPDRDNDFRLLEHELYLTATDLDTCERIVLGGAEWDDVPISRAVAASTALPMVYKPVEIKGRHLIDGGIRSTTNVDVAVEARREVHDRGEPARPVRQRLPEGDPDDVGQPRAARRRHGLPADRLPGVQAARPPAPARGGRATGRRSTRASTSS